MTWDENAARAAAEERLAAFRAQLAGQGVTAGGEIGDRDPVAAVRDCARGRDVSEIILSTLPGWRLALAPPGRAEPDEGGDGRAGDGRDRAGSDGRTELTPSLRRRPAS